ncbi:MAG: hypothetical protein AN482_16510 [Anabaena sp. LE011-02]|nr:MAG: hypothetical protein AN482_16510 [Anabaena sp. LE011-02]
MDFNIIVPENSIGATDTQYDIEYNSNLKIENNHIIKHKLLLDNIQYLQKPDKQEIKRINKRLPKCSVEITIEEFAKSIVIPNSQTWVAAYLEGGRKNEYWKSQSIFALDFDSGITFDNVLTRLKEYGLDCTFAYSTFSSSEEIPKFRVTFQLKEVITDKSTRDSIQITLMALFPECDKQCKDAARIYFGGKELIYSNYDSYLDLPQLVESTRIYVAENTTNVSQSLQRLDRKTKNLEKCYKNGTDNNIYIDNSRFITNSEESLDLRELLRVDWGDLRLKIKILDAFMNGKWLFHNELFGLATNMIHLRGGEKLFKECLNLNPNYVKGKYNLIGVVKYYKYNPMRLDNFSPYEEDWAYKNLIEASVKKKVIRLEQYNTKTIQELRDDLQESLSNTLGSNDNFIHIFKAATGLGKTELCTELTNILLALPNHSLKSEVAMRMKVNYKNTPSLDTLPKEVQKRLEYLYSIGANSQATSYLKDMAKTNLACEEYLRNTQACYASTDTVITTHKKAVLIDSWLHNTIIFDEDLISTILPINKVYMKDLITLEGNLTNDKDKATLNQIIFNIINSRPNLPIPLVVPRFENFQDIEDEVLNSSVKYDGNLLDFFCCDYFIVDSHNEGTIHYIKKHDLPENKKVIILSATANEEIYRYLFGDRLRFYDLSNVETIGLIKQDTTYSYSRQSLKQHQEYISKLVDDIPTITFKNQKDNFDNPVEDIHFGKAVGSNELKGKDIAVVGTPHISPIVVGLYASILGIRLNEKDLNDRGYYHFKQQQVIHNGYQFWISTYNNQDLRNIQFYFIESELKQAVGRARPNTEPVTVHLFSNYPLPEACISDEEIEAGKIKLQINKELVANTELEEFVFDEELTDI